MQTRSQTRQSATTVKRPIIEYHIRTRSYTRNKTVDFDFDEASQAWLANKISLGNGTYMYK
jgi:hypothetical protein